MPALRPDLARRPTPSQPPIMRTALAALMLASFSQAQAQSQAEGTLDTVVVTASGFEQELKEAPASVSVVTRQQLEERPYRDLAEALQNVEGLDVHGATGKTGGLNISIRGMPSEYTLILVDGRRQGSAGDITPNGFGDALTSLIPPVSAIERIEVLRGPMSTLYGSDAMGGVINIITRKVAKTWGGSVDASVGIAEESKAGNSRRFGFYLNGPIVDDRLGLALRGSIFRRSASNLEADSAGGSISTRGPSPTETRQHEIGARLSLTPDKDNDVWLDVSQGKTWYNNDECQLGTIDRLTCPALTPTAAVTGYRDYMRFNRDDVALGHTGRYGFGRLESSLTRSTIETLGRTIPSAARPAGDPSIGTDRKLEATNTVLDSKLVTPLAENHLATLGLQYWDAEMTDGLVSAKFQQTIWSLFAEDEWRLRPDLAATLGLRYDHHDAFGSHISPRAYLVWNANEQFTVKGGVNRGFKAPRLNQLVDGANGIGGQGTSISIGNPNLKPETATTTEVGVLWDNQAGTSANATLFYNRISDKITTGGDCSIDPISSCAASNNPDTTYSINRERGKTWGMELGTRFALATSWSLRFNYTYTDSELTDEGRDLGQLSDTAKHVGNAILRYEPSETWGAWLRAEYRGKSRRFDGDVAALTGAAAQEYQAIGGDLKGYGLMHIGGHYRVMRGLTFQASIENLLDKNFRKFSPYQTASGDTAWANDYIRSAQATKGFLPAGRTLWLSVGYDF